MGTQSFKKGKTSKIYDKNYLLFNSPKWDDKEDYKITLGFDPATHTGVCIIYHLDNIIYRVVGKSFRQKYSNGNNVLQKDRQKVWAEMIKKDETTFYEIDNIVVEELNKIEFTKFDKFGNKELDAFGKAKKGVNMNSIRSTQGNITKIVDDFETILYNLNSDLEIIMDKPNRINKNISTLGYGTINSFTTGREQKKEIYVNIISGFLQTDIFSTDTIPSGRVYDIADAVACAISGMVSKYNTIELKGEE